MLPDLSKTVTLKVWHEDGTRDGGSGHPLREGWWWQVEADGHRRRAWAIGERAAWHAVSREAFLLCSPEVKVV